MKKIILILLVIATSNAALSQTTLSPQMVNSAGGSGMVNNVYYDFTVGEPYIAYGGTSCDSIFAGFQHCAQDTLEIKKNNAAIGGPTTFCSNSNVILTAPNGASWLWTPGGVTTQTVSVNTSGNYKVRTTNSCGDTINSNWININVLSPPTPDICMVDVDSATLYLYNFVYWDKTLYPQADSFVIYRETSTNVYTRLGAVSKDSLSRFQDTARSIAGPSGGHPDYGYYKYKISVIDTCGVQGNKSLYHETVFFQDQQNSNFNWNQYGVEGQSTPVTNFYLMRDNNNTNNYVTIATYAGGATAGTDPQYSFYQTTANWRVDAAGFNCTPTMRYGNNGTQGAVVKSRSNVKNNRTTGNQWAVRGGQFAVFPNPANTEVTVVLSKNCDNCQVEIMNMLGETVKTVPATGTENKLDISDLNNGVYFVKVKNDLALFLQKLVVQH